MDKAKADFLQFLGTGSGFADTHNNAFWFADVLFCADAPSTQSDCRQCLFLIDLSLLNFQKVVKLIEDSGVCYVVILLTHIHPDHASGIGTLMDWAEGRRRFHQKEIYVHVVCGSHELAKQLEKLLTISGTTAYAKHDTCCSILQMDPIFHHISPLYRKSNHNMLYYSSNATAHSQGEALDYLFQPVAVTHGTMSAFGWLINPQNGPLIVYTGDTDSIEYFDRQVIQLLDAVKRQNILFGQTHTVDMECYCTMETYPKSGRNMTMNGNSQEVLDRLKILYHESVVRSLRCVFMHYNDYDELARQLETSGFNDEVGKLSPKVSVEIATPAEI
ncbi:hypothetical protein IKD60_02425 [Candidatus Saccharibacteria bacterium]|nr:hypothetical protein [Candidatus Saccharibacteria bacterium]